MYVLVVCLGGAQRSLSTASRSFRSIQCHHRPSVHHLVGKTRPAFPSVRADVRSAKRPLTAGRATCFRRLKKRMAFQLVEILYTTNKTHLARCRATIYAWGGQRRDDDRRRGGRPLRRKSRRARHHRSRRVTEVGLPEPSWAPMPESRDFLRQMPNSAAVNANARDHRSKGDDECDGYRGGPSSGQDEIRGMRREGHRHQAWPRTSSTACEHARSRGPSFCHAPSRYRRKVP